jgi:hypothetical protein
VVVHRGDALQSLAAGGSEDDREEENAWAPDEMSRW